MAREEAGVPTVTTVESGAAEEGVEAGEALVEVMGTSPTALCLHAHVRNPPGQYPLGECWYCGKDGHSGIECDARARNEPSVTTLASISTLERILRREDWKDDPGEPIQVPGLCHDPYGTHSARDRPP